MDLGLKGKKVLVSASTSGIGFAAAKLFLQNGAEVIVNGRSPTSVSQAVEKLEPFSSTGKVDGVAADLSQAVGMERLVHEFSEVDVLANNLGIYESKPFERISDEDWRRLFEINVLSGVRLARHYLKEMLTRNWGRIIFVSSDSSLVIPTDMIHYGMTKAAQVAIARGLANLTHATGVTVNSVLCGPTLTDGVQEFVKSSLAQSDGDIVKWEREFFATKRATSIIQRFATPEETAAMILYLGSALSSVTNGAALRAEGGLVPSAF